MKYCGSGPEAVALAISASTRRAASAIAGADRAGPGGKQQAAGAPRQQSELLRQRRRAAAGREGAITIAGDLMADAEIVKRVGKRVGMIERLGKRKPTRDALCRLLCLAGHLQRHCGADVGANAGIVAAEGGAKMTVALHVIGFDTDPAVVQSCRHIAAEKSRGPLAMVGFEQQIAVAGALRERHQLTCPVASERRLAPHVGVEPQAPFGSERGGPVVDGLGELRGATIGVLRLGALQTARHHERRA